MSEHLRTVYHEAGHALIARDLGIRLESVSLKFSGGQVRQEPLAQDATDEEIERRLVVVFAGQEAERYAPQTRAWRSDDDIWLTDGEFAMLTPSEDDEGRPSDEDVIAHYTKRIGAEAIERARDLAVELVERMHRVGRLERLADEILLRGDLTGDDIERLLGAPA